MDAAAKKIMDRIGAGKYDPVYVLQGEETYYIDLISNYIEANALSESDKGFNQVVLYGKDVTVATILTHAKRFPMMAERQVVIVKEAQEIQDLQKEAGSKLLLDYLARPLLSTILVLCHKHKTLDKRRELGKKIDQLAVSVAFKKPYENQLGEFVIGYLKGKGKQIDDGAVRILAEYVGNDLNRLANEIEKVLIAVPANEPVSAEHVMSQVGISKEYNIFELQKALIRRDLFQVSKIVNYFEANTKKNPVIPMIAFLYSFFSKLLVAYSTSDRSERGLVTALKISPFAAKDYSAALNYYPLDRVIESISLLKQADLKLKGVDSGNTGEGQILKEVIFRLMM
jgi:DNA polymerase III subunit delta